MWHLREVPHCVGTLNPHKEEGVKLVMEMLRQVVSLHPGLSTLHIGADEVRTSLLLESLGFAVLSHVRFCSASRFTCLERGRILKGGWLHLDIRWSDCSSVT